MTTPAHDHEPAERPVETDRDTSQTSPGEPVAAESAPVETAVTAKPQREVDPELAAKMRRLRTWLIVGFLAVAAVLVAVLIWTQFLPRWWAQTIGRQTGGTFSGGVGWGLIHGFFFTLIPLLLLGLAVMRPWKTPLVRIVLVVLAALVALPNLITLSVSLAPGNANEVARTTMDVTAPWFRGSVLIGAIVAGLAAFALGIWVVIQGRRNRELVELRAEKIARDGKLR